MKPYKHNWYPSPINIPESRSGPISITHRIIKAGETTPVVGQRQWLTRALAGDDGAFPINACPQQDLRVHELREGNLGIWMTDLPEELNQIHEAIYYTKPSGHVLIGGLGLGILTQEISKLKGVSTVTIIEHNKHVIKLCHPKHNGDRWWPWPVFKSDIHQYLKTADLDFDCYMLDTWVGTNEITYWSDVIPLRRLIGQRHMGNRLPKIWCWAEDIMRSQAQRCMLNPENRQWFYSIFPKTMTPQRCRWFFENAGTPRWEQLYGVKLDAYTKSRKHR